MAPLLKRGAPSSPLPWWKREKEDQRRKGKESLGRRHGIERNGGSSSSSSNIGKRRRWCNIHMITRIIGIISLLLYLFCLLITTIHVHNNHTPTSTTRNPLLLGNLFISNDGGRRVITTTTSTTTTIATTTNADTVVVDDNPKKNVKPYFIIHVGPQKTMSSSIQCTLQSLQTNLTNIDNYVFLGKVDMRACGLQEMKINSTILEPLGYDNKEKQCIKAMLQILQETEKEEKDDKHHHGYGHVDNHHHHQRKDPLLFDKLYQNVPCYRKFSDLLDSYASKNTNLILSDEKLSEIHLRWLSPRDQVSIPLLSNIILPRIQQQYTIRVIIVYRRYYIWLTSLKNQGDKYSLGRPGMKRWYGPRKEPIFDILEKWVSNTTLIPSPYTVPEIYTFYQNILNSLEDGNDEFKSNKNNNENQVVLLNMHDTTPSLLDKFLCDSIPNAYYTCNEYRTNPKFHQEQHEGSSSNPSIIPFYDQIAYEAYHKGFIRDLRGYRKGSDRLFVTEMISRRNEKILKQKPYNLPLICPTRQQVQFLLDITIYYELEYNKLVKVILQQRQQKQSGVRDLTTTATTTTAVEVNDGSTTIASSIQEQFEKDYINHKFCSVNVTEVLNDNGWKQFLLKLWHPKRGPKPINWDTSTYTVTQQNYSDVKPLS